MAPTSTKHGVGLRPRFRYFILCLALLGSWAFPGLTEAQYTDTTHIVLDVNQDDNSITITAKLPIHKLRISVDDAVNWSVINDTLTYTNIVVSDAGGYLELEFGDYTNSLDGKTGVIKLQPSFVAPENVVATVLGWGFLNGADYALIYNKQHTMAWSTGNTENIPANGQTSQSSGDFSANVICSGTDQITVTGISKAPWAPVVCSCTGFNIATQICTGGQWQEWEDLGIGQLRGITLVQPEGSFKFTGPAPAVGTVVTVTFFAQLINGTTASKTFNLTTEDCSGSGGGSTGGGGDPPADDGTTLTDILNELKELDHDDDNPKIDTTNEILTGIEQRAGYIKDNTFGTQVNTAGIKTDTANISSNTDGMLGSLVDSVVKLDSIVEGVDFSNTKLTDIYALEAEALSGIESNTQGAESSLADIVNKFAINNLVAAENASSNEETKEYGRSNVEESYKRYDQLESMGSDLRLIRDKNSESDDYFREDYTPDSEVPTTSIPLLESESVDPGSGFNGPSVSGEVTPMPILGTLNFTLPDGSTSTQIIDPQMIGSINSSAFHGAAETFTQARIFFRGLLSAILVMALVMTGFRFLH